MQNGLTSRLGHWAKKPFTEDMDLISWGLLTVFVVTVAALWYITLNRLLEEL